ncbi:MAG: hypothetical protein HXY41_07095 [Chloroflexi bacterium]|nr:hypothetical protein [Chloroflexota bacterium]
MPVINDSVRQVYNAVKQELMRQNYGMKTAMLEAKLRIIQYEKAQRSNRPLQSEGFFGRLFEAVGQSVSDNVAISDLENQLNALIVEDLSLL